MAMEIDGAADGSAPTPVTVLTGALGAGKTTLLRYILEKPHGYRVAVIQNEFSEEMGIESPLITDANGANFKDIVELPNGCLCCSAKDGLISALDNLLEDRKRFDYVVVEATGVADPESICEIFWVDEGLGSKVYLDGVIALVDCRNALSALGQEHDVAPTSAGGQERADQGDAAMLGLEAESAKQIACADVLVLNKVDLVPDAATRDRVARRIKAMNPTAGLLESTRSVVPLGDILGIKAFDRSRLATTIADLSVQPDVAGCNDANCTDHGHSESHAHSHGDGHGHSEVHAHGHGDGHGHSEGHAQGHGDGHGHISAPVHGVESFLVRGRSPATLYDVSKVNAWLADVLWEGSAGGVFRCKGLFKGPREDDDGDDDHASGKGCTVATPASATALYALQAVGKIFEVEEVQCSVDVPQSKLLFIGRNLDRQALVDGWRKCAAS